MTNGAGIGFAVTDGDVIAIRIGARVRFIRVGNGWTRSELAQRVGVAQAVVERIEDGLRLPTIALLYRLSAALEVAPGELLPATDERPRVEVQLPITDDPQSSTARIIGGGRGSATQTYLFDLRAGEHDIGVGQHRGDELLVVMEGEVVCSVLGRQDEVIGAGRSHVIDTSVPHGIRAAEGGPARFLLVCTDACDG